jgi:hypothetical protein
MGRSVLPSLIVFVGLALAPPPAAAQTKPAAKAPARAQATPPAAEEENPREVNLRAYAELLRSDVRAEKTALLAGVLQLSEQEDQKFWPIYREYEGELAKLNDERIAIVKDYADHYEQLTDEVADKLVLRALDVQSRRNTLQGTYYTRLKSVLPARTAARVLQVEHQILLLLDLQIAASLPIVQGSAK